MEILLSDTENGKKFNVWLFSHHDTPTAILEFPNNRKWKYIFMFCQEHSASEGVM